MKTIFAQSSKPGKAGVAIFRISGDGSIFTLKKLLKNKNNRQISPKKMYLYKIYDPRNGELIDHAMCAYFKAPASFTGEDVVEIYTHGSIAIAKMLTSALLNLGLRLAEPGEFARRAFLNNKFDLTAAEGLADLIEAETIMQHKQAIRQTEGALGEVYSTWRKQLVKIISLLEAYIDFPDEDIPEEVLNTVNTTVEKLKSTFSLHLDDNRRGELLRNGLKLAIIGEPNVGKSSLVNFLMQRDLSIVSDIPGTTRDVIEGHLDIGGYPILLQDTAGIRNHTTDLIEQEGIKRAINSAQNANIKIIMLSFEQKTLSKELKELIDNNTILVINKIDLGNTDFKLAINKEQIIKISVKNNIGLDDLLKEIERIAHNIAGIMQTPQITRIRHRHQIERALDCLINFNIKEDLVLATEDIRMAIRNLSTITGIITIDEILGEIFGNFCIGK